MIEDLPLLLPLLLRSLIPWKITLFLVLSLVFSWGRIRDGALWWRPTNAESTRLFRHVGFLRWGTWDLPTFPTLLRSLVCAVGTTKGIGEAGHVQLDSSRMVSTMGVDRIGLNGLGCCNMRLCLLSAHDIISLLSPQNLQSSFSLSLSLFRFLT
jgi:hypothetical protein